VFADLSRFLSARDEVVMGQGRLTVGAFNFDSFFPLAFSDVALLEFYHSNIFASISARVCMFLCVYLSIYASASAFQGSDGIWEFISSQEAVDMVAESKTIEEACQRLCDEATRRWKHEEDVIDDITCVVIELNSDDDSSAPASASSSAAASSSSGAPASLSVSAGRPSALSAPSPTAAGKAVTPSPSAAAAAAAKKATTPVAAKKW
jgi:hypothetical protein